MSDLTTHLHATSETATRPRLSPRGAPYSDVTRLGVFAVPVLLALTLIASFALRLYCLDCHGFWGDEVASLEGAALGLPDMITGRFGWIANQTPLHYIIVWLTTLPLDPTESTVLVRLPQAVAGALTPLIMYGLGKEMFGRTQGL